MNAPTVNTVPTSGTLPPTLVPIARHALTAEDYAVLPAEMRNARRWLLWKEKPNEHGKKPRKVP